MVSQHLALTKVTAKLAEADVSQHKAEAEALAQQLVLLHVESEQRIAILDSEHTERTRVQLQSAVLAQKRAVEQIAVQVRLHVLRK